MDQERILSKFDKIETYLEELEKIKVVDLEEYKRSIKDKRASERLLQISVENVLDICNILVSELRLGLPSDEGDIFQKLYKKKIISRDMKNILINMKGLRNILVHRYGEIDDEKVHEVLTDNLEDFDKFKEEIISFLEK